MLKELTKVFLTVDSRFSKKNLERHFEKRKRLGELGPNRTPEEYDRAAEKLSLKKADGKSIQAYKVGNRIVKSDGRNIVVYSEPYTISYYPIRGWDRFKNKREKEKGTKVYC